MNRDPVNRLADGDYARKQIFCRSRVVAWSHGSRFDLARRLAGERQGGRLLDYGCGDGTFVAMVHEQFRDAMGVDVEQDQVAECVRRLGDLPGVRFATTATLAGTDAGGWDVVTCMEVLEHCLEPERRRILDRLSDLCAIDGLVIISVPIEVGPSVIGKHFFRALAGLRRLGDYAHRERYTAAELLRSAAGRRIPRVSFEGHGVDGPFRYYGHKGFDWRELEGEIRERLVIEQRRFTPMPRLGAVLNSQVWFVCRRR